MKKTDLKKPEESNQDFRRFFSCATSFEKTYEKKPIPLTPISMKWESEGWLFAFGIKTKCHDNFMFSGVTL